MAIPDLTTDCSLVCQSSVCSSSHASQPKSAAAADSQIALILPLVVLPDITANCSLVLSEQHSGCEASHAQWKAAAAIHPPVALACHQSHLCDVHENATVISATGSAPVTRKLGRAQAMHSFYSKSPTDTPCSALVVNLECQPCWANQFTSAALPPMILPRLGQQSLCLASTGVQPDQRAWARPSFRAAQLNYLTVTGAGFVCDPEKDLIPRHICSMN